MSKQRLTIEEVIEHCERRIDRAESFFKKEKLEEMPIDGSMVKEYWEHRQVREWLIELIERRKQSEIDHVQHGKWVHIGGDEWACSSCGFVISTEGSWDQPTKKYCEECGAKMDKEE